MKTTVYQFKQHRYHAAYWKCPPIVLTLLPLSSQTSSWSISWILKQFLPDCLQNILKLVSVFLV